MGITIIAGGCRTASEDGKIVEENSCNTCDRQGVCELEPRARQLAELMSEQWVSTGEDLPPDMYPILYLEYPSEAAGGTVHFGYYDGESRVYCEWASKLSLAEESVVAWMLVPEVPERIYKSHNSILQSL